MLNETASSTNDRPALRHPVRLPPQAERVRDEALRELVAGVLMIHDEDYQPSLEILARDFVVVMNPNTRFVATFSGKLLHDSEAAYEQLDRALAERDEYAIFRTVDDKHVIHILSGRVTPKPHAVWVNVVLFLITVFSVLVLGTQMAINEIAATNIFRARAIAENFFLELWRGLPYAVSILLILGSHELGHYFAARRHRLAVTLPYFIPAPFISFLGTFGAFIQLREPMRNRKVLLDVGASGPLAGLVFAIPIVLIGLATSRVGPIEPGGVLEGNSLLYALAKILVFGRFLPDGEVDVYINQVAMAGWAGLLVTALNLIPLGQLDGGHILYALIGNRARKLYFPLIAVSIALALITNAWILWVILLLLFGRTYAAPLDMITPLDRRRQIIAVVSLVIFVLIFVPVPLIYLDDAQTPARLRDSVFALPVMTAVIVSLFQRLRR
ncbi:MAG: site-2 protease family protein [Chloroflexota bacterium]|nr:MAG: site-2 protease family protein [Chloroflexota bacterium]